MSKPEYTVDWFIQFFDAQPDDLWTVGMARVTHDDGVTRHCAIGFCQMDTPRSSEEFSEREIALSHLLFPGQAYIHHLERVIAVTKINDGHDPRYKQTTPKQRILAALADIKAKQSPPPQHQPVQHPCVHLFMADCCVYCGHVKQPELVEAK